MATGTSPRKGLLFVNQNRVGLVLHLCFLQDEAPIENQEAEDSGLVSTEVDSKLKQKIIRMAWN